jgi:hypothetical protein
MELIIKRSYMEGNDWDSDALTDDTLEVTFDGKSTSYNVGEGESEDMIFGRNLEDTSSIFTMIKMAYEAGKIGAEMKYSEHLDE